jgi:cytochrome b
LTPERAFVWDLPLRLSHAALAVCVAGSFVTHWIGSAAFRWHEACGCTTLGLVAFRLAWGVVGTRHARFANFVRGPRAVARYARALVRRAPAAAVGHNPLGGWMVLALLALLLAQAASGLIANDAVVDAGPLYGYVGEAQSDAASHLHRALSNWILAGACLHVLTVLAYRVVLHTDLIRPMLTGFKHGLPPGAGIERSRRGQRLALAALLVGAFAALLGWLLYTAPEVVLIPS